MTYLIFRLFLFISVHWHKPAALNLLPKPDRTGVASRYGDRGDIYAMQALACVPSVHLNNKMHVCAHRYLPCGTVLILQTVRTENLTWCVVADRGPYGALVSGENGKEWTIKIKPSDPGVWRGILDMSPAVAKEMEHNGFEPIRYWVLSRAGTAQYVRIVRNSI